MSINYSLGGSDWTLEDKSLSELSHWNNLSREVVDSLMLDTLMIQLNMVLGHLVSSVLLSRKGGPDDYSGPLQLTIL